MKKTIVYLFLLLLPIVNNANVTELEPVKGDNRDIYAVANLSKTGLARDVFEMALKGLNRLDSSNKLQNPGIVTIADYSQSSNKKRFYVIDLKNK
jgi:hypothetical protein